MIRSGKYFLVCLIGSVLFAVTIGNPLPQHSSGDEINLVSSTTEHPHNAIGRIYATPTDKPGGIRHAAGVHQFRIGPDEDERKRILDEYYYHFVRVEKNLPHTTERFQLGRTMNRN